MENLPERIVVVGAGGMGALFGAILQDGGLSVTLYDTNAAQVDAIERDGLRISGYGGERTVEIAATSDPMQIEAADVLLFQCKAQGTRPGIAVVRHLVDKGAVCISFQNGLGNEEALADVVGEDNVLGGVTTMAGMLLAPGHVRDFSRVPSYIGELGGGISDRAASIAEAFSKAGLETAASANIRQDIWKKLLGNIAMSALSGTTNLTSAACLTNPELKSTSIRALDEALLVAKAHGIELDRADAIRGMEAISVPGGTGDNKSSLCVDILNRRPSEVDTIYGSVIERGRQKSIPMPTLETLFSVVKGIESHYVEEN